MLAVRANTSHGLPLARADRRAAARRILCSHPQWSDRVIATVAGVAADTVGRLRRSPDRRDPAGPDPDGSSQVAARPTERGPQSDTRMGRDGRARPVNGAKGREAASRLIAAQPEASLREIARQAGISPETVRDVRARLNRGDNPVPPRQRATTDASNRAASNRDGADHAAVEAATMAAAKRLRRRRAMRRGGRPLVAEAVQAAPALPHNEAGRALLQMLDTERIIEGHGELLVRSVPAHCRGRVAAAARACARKYQALAERIMPDMSN